MTTKTTIHRAHSQLCIRSIGLSGNNYSKFAMLCKELNLSYVSKSIFTVSRQSMPCLLLGTCGPKCGTYYVHTLLEHATKVLFDLEVIDNRETGGNSTTMEREALRRLLERLVIELLLGELCTDASSTIIKLVRDMKGRLCDFSEKPVMLYYFYYCCLFFISKFFLITHFIIFTVA